MQTYDTVQIFASISTDSPTRVSDDGASFTDGDMIRVENTSRQTNNIATFKYSSSAGKWLTEDVMLWEGYGDNLFKGWYPASASFGSFTIPADQSAGYGTADWMTSIASAKASDGGVGLLFSHHLVKVIVEAASWGSEFELDDQKIESLDLLSLSTGMTNNGTTVSGDEMAVFVKACPAQSGAFMALVAPGTYPSGAEIMHLQVGDEQLAVKTSGEVEILAGKAYTFKVNVGKNLIVVSDDDVAVSDWSNVTLEDQEFEEVVYELADGTPVEYSLSFESSELNIPIVSNVGPEVSIVYVTPETDWITYDESATKSALENNLVFSVASNKGTTTRQAQIKLYNSYIDKTITLTISQIPFTGMDDSALDKNKYITYVADEDYEGYGDAFDYNMYYYGTKIRSSGLERSSKIECKFKLNDFEEGNFHISVGEYDDGAYKIYLCKEGLRVDSKLYSWADMGVSKTSVITLTLSGTTMIVNGKTIEGIPSIIEYLDGYIWSGHYYDRDDGVYYVDYTFQDGGRIYYAKGWDSDGKLIYIGSAALSSDGRACWKSVYYDSYSGNLSTTEHFPRVTSSFGRGNL